MCNNREFALTHTRSEEQIKQSTVQPHTRAEIQINYLKYIAAILKVSGKGIAHKSKEDKSKMLIIQGKHQ